MVRLSNESRSVITLHSKGNSVADIRRRLQQENISISRQALYNLINKFCMRTLVVDGQPRGWKRKITKEMESVIEDVLCNNDEITSTGLRSLLDSRWLELQVSIPTIKCV